MIIKYSKRLDRTKQKKGYPKDIAVKKIKRIALSVLPGYDILETCRICMESTAVDFASTYGYLWKLCRTCNSIFVADPPSSEDLEKMYKSEEFASMNRHIFNEDNMWFRVREIVQPKYNFIKRHITTRKDTWLDIGCGPGELLYIVKEDGWNAKGIDTDPLSAEIGKKYFDVEISDDYFSLVKAANMDCKYGVISMMNVLEHCLEPRHLLEAASLMQDVGDNLLIELPHFPSLSAYLCKAFPELISRVMTPPLHLFVFSIKGTIKMLEEFGYSPAACWLYGQDIGELLDMLDALSSSPVSFSKMLSPILNNLQESVDAKLFGDHFVLFAEKRR